MGTFILWDIDGTLIYNTPKAGSLYVEAIRLASGTAPTTRVPNPHGMTEGQLLAAILEVNGRDPALIGDVLVHLDRLSLEQHEAGHLREACKGTATAITAFAEHGWTNALLTGNGPNRSRYKLLAAGYDVDAFDWEHSYFGHDQPTRHHLTAGARDALRGHHAFIIGDTPNDGLAADSAGIPFIAVATGAFTATELRHTGAILVIDDFESGLDAATASITAAIGS